MLPYHGIQSQLILLPIYFVKNKKQIVLKKNHMEPPHISLWVYWCTNMFSIKVTYIPFLIEDCCFMFYYLIKIDLFCFLRFKLCGHLNAVFLLRFFHKYAIDLIHIINIINIVSVVYGRVWLFKYYWVPIFVHACKVWPLYRNILVKFIPFCNKIRNFQTF